MVASVRSAVQKFQAEVKESNGNFGGAKRLYAQTLASLESALNSSPTDCALLLQIAGVLLKMHDMSSDTVALSRAERYCRLAADGDTAADALAMLAAIKGDNVSSCDVLWCELQKCKALTRNANRAARRAR